MIKPFLNESRDGMLQKDWLVLIFSITFIALIFYATYEWSIGKNISGLLTIIETVGTPMSIIIGGVFTMGSVQLFSQGRQVSMSQQPMNPYNQYGGYGGYNNYSPYNNYQPIQQPIISEEENVQPSTNTNVTNVTKPPV